MLSLGQILLKMLHNVTKAYDFTWGKDMEKNTSEPFDIHKNWANLIKNEKIMDRVNKKSIYKPRKLCYTQSIISDVVWQKAKETSAFFSSAFL